MYYALKIMKMYTRYNCMKACETINKFLTVKILHDAGYFDCRSIMT